MSPAEVVRRSSAATHSHAAQPSSSGLPGRNLQDVAAGVGDLAKGRQPARLGPARKAQPRPYADPCTYLG